MFTALVAQAEDFDTRRAARNLISQCEHDLNGRTPAGGLLFCSVEFEHAHILQQISAAFPGMPLAGCTTAGEISSQYGFSLDSIVLMLFCSDTVTISTGYAEGAGKEPARAVAKAIAMAGSGSNGDPSLCLAFPDGVTTLHSEILKELTCILPPGCPLFGGAAARQYDPLFERIGGAAGPNNEPSLQFCNNGIHTDSVTLMLFYGPLQYDFAVANGWQPIGPRTKITSSSGKQVKRIGDSTAVDFYRHYLGPRATPALEFPLAVFEPGSDGFYLRVPHEFDEETGTIMFRGGIPAGAVIQLTEAVRDRVVSDAAASVNGLASAPRDFNPAAGLAFSCRVRNNILGTRIREENEVLKAQLPAGIPIAGFYGFGEFSPLKKGHQSRLHNSTLVTLLLGDTETPLPVETGSSSTSRSTELMNATYLHRRLQRIQLKRRRLEQQQDFSASMQRTIMDEVIQAREKIKQQNDELQKLYQELGKEKKKSDQLLLNILPDDVAEELKATGKVEPVFFDSATVMFADFKDFTRIAGRISPAQLVEELDYHFSWFDHIVEKHGLEKLKTIGDAYMCAGGLPAPKEGHALNTVRAAQEMQEYMRTYKEQHSGPDDINWELRIGINTGPLMAGVIGKKKFAYDIWGDTVNIAARVETAGEAGRINVSETTYELIKDEIACEHRGRIHAKNKGEIDMYYVNLDA